MSAETDFRTALLAHAPLVSLVAQRVAANAANQGEALPYVAFQAGHEAQRNLEGARQLDRVLFTVECWGKTAAQATEVADAVEAAIEAHMAAAPANVAAWVQARASGFDADLGLDGEVLTVEWWQQ